jgi:hypothetical protein
MEIRTVGAAHTTAKNQLTEHRNPPFVSALDIAKSSRSRKRNQNRNRNHPGILSSSAKERAHESLRRFVNTPPPILGDDLSQLRIIPGNGNDPAPPPLANAEPVESLAGAGLGSRANAVKGTFRSKILFTLEMFEAIQKASERFTAVLKPVGALEEYLVREMARSSTQDGKCAEQLEVDGLRVVERVGTSWDLDKSARVDKLGTKLAESPRLVAGELGRTKHGALYLINQWSALDEAIATNGGLDEPQRQVAHDLLGIDHAYRNGSRQVPSGTDAPGLKALVPRVLGRHRDNLERTLNACDTAEHKMAMLGLVSLRDATSRLLRADENRARRRFSWAMDTLWMLRAGADPAGIIDPDTGKPVVPGPRPTAVREKAPAAAAPPPEPEPERAPSPAPSIPPLPEGISVDAKEMILVAAGSFLVETATSPAPADGARPPVA